MRRSCSAVPLLALLACGGDAGGADSASAEEKAVLGALCDFIARCPSDHFAFETNDRDECIDALYFVLTCKLDFERDAYGVDQPTVTMSPMSPDNDALRACEDWLAASSCQSWPYANDGPCEVLAYSFANANDDDDDGDDAGEDTGPPRAGESCERTYTCAEGLQCIDYNGTPGYPDASETELCRVCVPLAGLGDGCEVVSCRWDDALELVCDPGTTTCVSAPSSGPCIGQVCATGNYCDDGACVARGVQGEECAVSRVWCDEGLHCAPDLGTCEGPAPDGALCWTQSSRDCASGFCNGDLEPDSGSHGRCDAGGYEGDPCTSSRGCRGSNCEPSLLVCIDRRRDGEPCYRDFQCQSGLCDEALERCGRRAAGEACAVDDECRERVCDFASGRCGRTDGSSCARDEECQGGGCVGGMCVTRSEVGGPCGSDAQCTSYRCYGGECRLACGDDVDCPSAQFCDHGNGSLCRPRGASGDACEDDEECASQFCNSEGACATRPGIGDPCSGDDCYPRGQCKSGRCVAQPGPGEACEGYDACLPPYACLDSVCTRMSLECRPAAAGERCTFFAVCDTGLYCDPLDGLTCKARLAVGRSCFFDPQCQAGARCERGTCAAAVPLKDDGEPCEDSDECLSDYCSGDECQPPGGLPQCVMP